MSILKLSPALKLLASFQVPRAAIVGDGDFGGSPTVFTATIKGKSERWQRRIGVKSSEKVLGQCQAAAAFDGHFLYMAGPGTTIGAKTFRGSVLRLNPATGAIGWQTGLPNGVLTSPSINGSGVIGVGTYDSTTRPNQTYLVSASTGAILRTLNPGFDFPQSAFADGWLYTAGSTGLYAWGP